MNRSTFHERSTTYLFSFDLDLHTQRDAMRAPNEAGPPIMTLAQHLPYQKRRPTEKQPFEDESRRAPVYNALQESRVLGEDAITGDVVFSQDHIEYPARAEFAKISGRMVIRTDDGHLIDAEYDGVARARGRWEVVRRSERDVETKAFITTHFETGSTKYQWLVKYRCLGFGRLTLRNGEPRVATFDLYALR